MQKQILYIVNILLIFNCTFSHQFYKKDVYFDSVIFLKTPVFQQIILWIKQILNNDKKFPPEKK